MFSIITSLNKTIKILICTRISFFYTCAETQNQRSCKVVAIMLSFFTLSSKIEIREDSWCPSLCNLKTLCFSARVISINLPGSYLFICPGLILFICPGLIYLSSRVLSFHLPGSISIYLPGSPLFICPGLLYLSARVLSIYLPGSYLIYLPESYLFICPCLYLFICPGLYLFICPSISIYLPGFYLFILPTHFSVNSVYFIKYACIFI